MTEHTVDVCLRLKRIFARYAQRYFQKAEDRNDFIQECFVEVLKSGKKSINALYVVKQARKTIKRKQYNVLLKKQYEIFAQDTDNATPLAEALIYCMPTNKNQALAQKPYVLEVNGVRFSLDRYDAAELFDMDPMSVKTARATGREMVMWLYNGKLYQTLKSVRAVTRTRLQKTREMAQKIVVRWVKD